MQPLVPGLQGKRKADDLGEKRKGRKKGFVWSHVTTDPATGKVVCIHCGENIKVAFGEKVERLRKHFIKSCPKSPFNRDSKEYEELLECITTAPLEHKKKTYAGRAKNSNKIICYNIDFANSVLAGSYSTLTPEQINQLEAQGNRSTNWAGVKLLCPTGVTYDSSLDKIRGCSFNGNIFIGLFVKTTIMQGGISVQSGLYNSSFSGNCVLSDNCYVWNTAMLMNVFVGRNSCIVGCGNLIGEGYTSFGTQRTITIGPEALGAEFGRSVQLNVKSSYADVVGAILRRGGKQVEEVPEFTVNPMAAAGVTGAGMMLQSGGVSSMGLGGPGRPATGKRPKYNRNDGHVRYDMTIICDDVEVSQCPLIRNCFIGSYSSVKDSSLNTCSVMAHCEVASTLMVESVMHQSCKVMGGAQLSGVLMFPHASVAAQAKVTECVLGPDSGVSVGECKNSLLGPMVGFHHQALLISACWTMGRGNLGYGSMIGANHTGRSNDQECFPGEGCFYGLGSSVLYPFCMMQAPYSVISAGVSCSPQKISFPFSLVADPLAPYPPALGEQHPLSPSLSTLKPGWVLISNPYFLERSMAKYTRRRRSVEYRTDLPIFRPTIADMVADARNRLLTAKDQQMIQHGRLLNAGQLTGTYLTERHVVGTGNAVMQGGDVDAAIEAYTQFIHRYALHGLVYMMALAGELPINLAVQASGGDISSPSAAIDGIMGDVRSMQAGLPSLGDHLHQLVTGSAGPPASSSAKVSASITSAAEPAASEISSPGARLLLGAGSASTCCLLTDTHNPAVRAHQLKVLSEEFPDVDFLAYIQARARGTLSNYDPKVKQLLQYLSELEQAYSEKVRLCKQKDTDRAMVIIPEFNEPSMEDEAVATARNRSGEIARVIQMLG